LIRKARKEKLSKKKRVGISEAKHQQEIMHKDGQEHHKSLLAS
jgi:hypothetical protein